MKVARLSLAADKRTPLVFASLAAALVLLTTSKYTVGLFPDSALFFATSRSLAEGAGFRSICDRLLLSRGPLYPLVLTPGIGVHIPLEVQARVLNVAVHAGTTLLVFQFLRKEAVTTGLLYLGTALVAVSYPLLWISRFAMPDALYVFLSVAALCSLLLSLRPGRRDSREAVGKDTRAGDATPESAGPAGNQAFRLIFLASVLTALATITRYNGIVLYVPLGGAMLITWRRGSLSPLRGIVAVAASCLPLALWFLRNYHLAGKLTRHAPMDRSPFEAMAVAARTITEWFYPFPLVWVLLMVLALIYGLRKKEAFRDRRPVLLLLTLYALAHGALLIYLASTRTVEMPGLRYMAPAFPPLVMIAILGLDRLDAGKWILGLGLIFLAGHAVLSARLVLETMNDGAGHFSTTFWQSSPVVHKMKELQASGAYVYCNFEPAGYLLGDLPMKYPTDAYPPHRWFKRVAPMFPPEQAVYMVWLPYKSYSGDIDESEPFEIPAEIVLDLPDKGRIYRIQ